MTDRLAGKAIRYEDLPGQLVFPGIDPNAEMLEDGKFRYLCGPACDEVRKFTYEELERFRELGGRMVAPMGICFADERGITLGIQLDGIVLETGE